MTATVKTQMYITSKTHRPSYYFTYSHPRAKKRKTQSNPGKRIGEWKLKVEPLLHSTQLSNEPGHNKKTTERKQIKTIARARTTRSSLSYCRKNIGGEANLRSSGGACCDGEDEERRRNARESRERMDLNAAVRYYSDRPMYYIQNGPFWACPGRALE